MKIVKNLPIPKRVNRKRPASVFVDMEVGDAAIFETRKEAITARQRMRRLGYATRFRQTDEGFVVWKTGINT